MDEHVSNDEYRSGGGQRSPSELKRPKPYHELTTDEIVALLEAEPIHTARLGTINGTHRCRSIGKHLTPGSPTAGSYSNRSATRWCSFDRVATDTCPLRDARRLPINQIAIAKRNAKGKPT